MARNRSRAESCRNPASIQLTHDPVTPTCHMRLPLSKSDVSRHAGTARMSDFISLIPSFPEHGRKTRKCSPLPTSRGAPEVESIPGSPKVAGPSSAPKGFPRCCGTPKEIPHCRVPGRPSRRGFIFERGPRWPGSKSQGDHDGVVQIPGRTAAIEMCAYRVGRCIGRRFAGIRAARTSQ
jgi:hypothetical protein